ncbi:major facilitator transporter [Opitutaceae bacterium TAV5]|nr:major facilitator transporter [Opitutaceae bacterium TAV5]
MAEHGFRRWIIVITVVTATVIELIDTSIVNVALTQMSGNLGATLEDVSWVVTAYAIANVIIIPITGFLAAIFGRRNYYLGSIILFTVTSILCGNATNIWELVAFRFLQGIGGGALLSTSQSILFETFEEKERGMAAAIFTVGVIFGPTIGPTLGGWIVDNYSWPWIFYVNMPVGVVAALLTWAFIKDPPDAMKRRVTIDWAGIGLLAAGIGSLQFVLERGETKDWFGTGYITAFTCVAVAALAAFVMWELHAKNPAVNLRVLKNRSLTVAALLTFVVGFGLFGSTYAVPVFSQQIIGMTAYETGLLMMPGALAAMVMSPISGRLMQHGFPPHVLAMAGFAMLGLFCWNLAVLTSQMGPQDFFWPLVLRGVGIASLSVPLTTMAVSGLQGRDLAQGVALNNMMRQLGGSFGIALINTYVAHRNFSNRTGLLAHVGAGDRLVQERLAALTAFFQAKGASIEAASRQAYLIIEQIIVRESAVISYADTFRVLAVFFVLCVPVVLLMKRSAGGRIVGGDH